MAIAIIVDGTFTSQYDCSTTLSVDSRGRCVSASIGVPLTVNDSIFEEQNHSRRGRFNVRLLIGAGVVALVVAYLIFLSLDAATAAYMNVDELAAAPDITDDRRLRIGGTVTAGSIVRGEDLLYEFEVHGEAATIPVVYQGAPPDIFGDNAVVFVEGYYTPGGTFNADVLLTRHPDTMEPLPTGATAPNYEPTYG
ncbi:MAG: cytochrome c maturation protein CcmE [Dehalococcoidia bacterium]|nr:cytochrome c maturation protein CcmE [Dehalococcoidia bacterium]